MILQPPNDIDSFLDPVFIAKENSHWMWVYGLLVLLVLFLCLFFIWKFYKKWKSRRKNLIHLETVEKVQTSSEFYEKKIFEKVTRNFENYLQDLDKTKLLEFEVWLRYLWFDRIGSQVFSWTHEEWINKARRQSFFTKVKEEEVFDEFLQRSQAFFYQESKAMDLFRITEEEASLFKRLKINLNANGERK